MQVRGWEGWTNESIELHLQTRFLQLETASALHRYTEGFRTVEDIYNILQISQVRRKHNPDIPPPKAKLMATYYEKLTTLFWVSENYLFHAFAWYKYYTLSREYNRGMSEEQKRTQASAVLMAALCIPQLPNQAGASEEKQQHRIGSTIQDDIMKQKTSRMATLLGFHTRNPTREALLVEIRSKNILDQVPQYLRDLYVLLESNSDPLTMVEQARPLLDQLKAEVGATTTTDSEKFNEDVEDTSLGRYVKPLTKVLLLKLIVNLSSAYHTVSMDHLKKLTAGLDMSFEQVEKAIVLLTQTKTLSVRIDHRAGCLRFGEPELESQAMRSQLVVLSKQLEELNRVLVPSTKDNKVERKKQVYGEVRANLESEHKSVLERKNLIEKRKEETERLAQEKAREEERIKAAEEAARRAEEEKRIAREQRLREQEKQRKIQQELENQEKKRFLAAMGKKTDQISEQEIAEIDAEALQKEHEAKINKKREEAERKLRDAAKKLDYLVRAIRIEELPVITKRYEEKTKKDRERYEQEVELKMKKAREQWEADVKDRQLLEDHKVFGFFDEFEEKIMRGRRIKHEAACKAADEAAEVEAEMGKLERARKRKQQELRKKQEEEERKKREEEDRKAEEAKRQREEAQREKDAKDEEAERRRMDRLAEEERKKESESKGPSRYVPPSRRNRGGDSGGTGSRFGGAGSYPGGGRYEGRSGGDRPSGDRGGDRGGERPRGGDRGDGPPSQTNTRWR